MALVMGSREDKYGSVHKKHCVTVRDVNITNMIVCCHVDADANVVQDWQ